MRIVIEQRVHDAIDSFYDAAVMRHWHTLSFETTERKKQRLYSGIRSLADYHTIYPKARLRQEWVAQEWQEFICEDFHFAYEVVIDSAGEEVIVIRDAVHSLMYR